MTTTVLELPQGFTFEKLQMLANLLDLKVIDFVDEAEQKEDIRLFDEGMADKTKGELAETVFARIEAQRP